MSTQAQPPQPQKSPALNALKHGLFAADHVLLKDENPDRHRQFMDGLIAALQPVGAEEESMALRIASHHWRLARVARYEASIWNSAMPMADSLRSLDRLSLYETRLSRQLERERGMLRELQKERRSAEAEVEENEEKPSSGATPGAVGAGATQAPVGDLKKRENAQNEPKIANDQPRRSCRAQLEEMERKTRELLNS